LKVGFLVPAFERIVLKAKPEQKEVAMIIMTRNDLFIAESLVECV
jgi:hypothetical protein